MVDPDDRCSFCGKGPDQVETVARRQGFRICRECVDLCRVTVDEELGRGWSGGGQPPGS